MKRLQESECNWSFRLWSFNWQSVDWTILEAKALWSNYKVENDMHFVLFFLLFSSWQERDCFLLFKHGFWHFSSVLFGHCFVNFLFYIMKSLNVPVIVSKWLLTVAKCHYLSFCSFICHCHWQFLPNNYWRYSYSRFELINPYFKGPVKSVWTRIWVKRCYEIQYPRWADNSETGGLTKLAA